MKVLFVTAGGIEWASSRIRAFWPARYMLDAQAICASDVQPEALKEADAVVFQKVFDTPAAKALREAGKIVVWDTCDPAWWFDPEGVREIVSNVDFVVCACDALAEDFRSWNRGSRLRVHTIRDRMDLDHYSLRRKHDAVDTVRLIWFGLAANRWSMLSTAANLERLVANGYRFELTIMDDRPDALFQIGQRYPVHHTAWSLALENEIISSHDVAILPPYPGPWGKVKTNNKQLTAWACGLPVVSGLEYKTLESMMDPVNRAHTANLGRDLLSMDFQAGQSAREWSQILNQEGLWKS